MGATSDLKIDREILQDESETLPKEKPMGTGRPVPVRLPLKKRRQYTVEVNPVICKGCGYCREMCLKGIFATSNSFNASGYKPSVVTSSDRCVGCLKCLYVCPDFAITIQEGRPEQCPAESAGQ